MEFVFNKSKQFHTINTTITRQIVIPQHKTYKYLKFNQQQNISCLLQFVSVLCLKIVGNYECNGNYMFEARISFGIDNIRVCSYTQTQLSSRTIYLCIYIYLAQTVQTSDLSNCDIEVDRFGEWEGGGVGWVTAKVPAKLYSF